MLRSVYRQKMPLSCLDLTVREAHLGQWSQDPTLALELRSSSPGHSGKGPAVMEYAGVAITAPFPGTLLTGLVAALGPACRLRRR